MQLSYKGKSAIITGASGGMGLEISKRLSQNNISVLMLDLKKPSNDFLKKNKNCEFKKVDVTNFKLMKTQIEKFYKNFGFDWGALLPRHPGILAGGAKPPDPLLNGRPQHLIEAAKRGRLDQMLFFSAPLTTRAPSTTVRPDVRPNVRPNARPDADEVKYL